MALKKRRDSLEGLDASLHSLYTKVGNEYILQVEGDGEDKSKIDEFRNTNKKLADQLATLTASFAKFEGIDLDKHKEAMEVLATIEKSAEAEDLKKGNVDAVVKRRLTAAEKQWQEQMKAKDKALEQYTAQLNGLTGRYGELLVTTRVASTINKIGKAREGALQDITLRAKADWKVNDKGELVPREGLNNAKGEPVSMDEWAGSLLKDAPYLFEAASGGGASGGTKGKTADGKIMVDRRDPIAMGRHAADLATGKAVAS